MLIPNNEMGFSMSDLYPNMGGVDTSTLANPEVDDQDALNEDVKVAEASTTTEASKKNIFIGLGILVALVIFFGGK